MFLPPHAFGAVSVVDSASFVVEGVDGAASTIREDGGSACRLLLSVKDVGDEEAKSDECRSQQSEEGCSVEHGVSLQFA